MKPKRVHFHERLSRTFPRFQGGVRPGEFKGGRSRWPDSAHHHASPSFGSHASLPSVRSRLLGAREELGRDAFWGL